jgi:hypothetical protein
MRQLLAGLLALLPLFGAAQPAPAMRTAVQQLLESLPPDMRARALRPFDDADRADWHYTPRSRGGISFKELDARGRESVHALLKTGLTAAGHRKVVNILELEIVLRELEMFGLMRDPEKYHLSIYGAPDARKAWSWRFEGHHLSLHFTLAGDRAVATTPSFLGANPAEVREGPRKGLRVLAEEEDSARALLASLDEGQRREAVFSAQTYGDIVTRNADKVAALETAGIPASRFSTVQRDLLLKLIETYANTFEPALAAARMARVRKGGVEAIRYGWAGSTRRGQPHYYRIQGPLFLIEYDASQNGGHHIHTVWRDFDGDFGRDLLREHHAAHRH